MDDEQSPEELSSNIGPGSPAQAAADWLDAVTGSDGLQAAWPLTDPNFRLVLIQDLLWRNRTHPTIAGHDLDTLAAEVVQGDPSNPLCLDFRSSLESQLAEWPDWVLDGQYSVASRPRPVLPEYELVLFVYDPTGEGFIWQPDTMVLAQTFLMHDTAEGWLVAGVESRLPLPGWPPESQEVA